MANPTNKDILEAVINLTSQVGVIETTLGAVKIQTEKTNGRVTKIEDWKNALIAVEQYKEKQQPVQQIKADTVVMTSPKWYEDNKVWGAIGTIGVALAAVLTVVLNLGGSK